MIGKRLFSPPPCWEKLNILLPAFALALAACSDEIAGTQPAGGTPIELYGEINQEYTTRANDDGFANGDRMGVFIVDYSGGKAGTLSVSGNRANNALFEYNAGDMKWTCATTFYYRDPNTLVDVYGYYPYTSAVNDVDEWLFTVEDNQAAEGAYEKSDFLWAKASGIKPSTDVIKLTYTHRMAGVMVTLTRGEGISEVEWDKVSKDVTVDNTVTIGTVDMKTGTVTASNASTTASSVKMCPQGGDVWRAVVIPQSVKGGTHLLGITIDGTSYIYMRAQDLTLAAGKLHRFTLKIDKKDGGDYTVALAGESITPWENDRVTHGFLEYEYTVVQTTEPGTLRYAIGAMGKDYARVKNLKIIGPLATEDFYFMRDEMHELQMLNMQNVVTKDILVENYWSNEEQREIRTVMDGAIPPDAFRGKRSLRRLVLPDEIERIGHSAFEGIGLDVNSTLYLPKRLKRIDYNAFRSIGEAGTLVLNDSLERIDGLCFYETSFSCELNFPKTLRYLDDSSLGNGGNNSYFFKVTGHFRLPEDMEYLGSAFDGIVYDEVGEIIVPKNAKTIKPYMFPRFTKGAYITLHDGIERIEWNANLSYRFLNHVRLPEGLTYIGREAFPWGTHFTAGITLPSTLRYMAENAFIGAQGLGNLTIPEGVVSIPTYCFADGAGIDNCILPNSCISIDEGAFRSSQLKSITIDKYCSSIGSEAFAYCGQLKTVICLNPEPPAMLYTDDEDYAFQGCDLDHLVLEVPEQSVELYRNTPGWNKIHFISAYHELAVGKSELTCLDGGMEYETLVRAEGEWEVSDCPDWCHVTPSKSKDRRTEITIKVDPTSRGNERSGRIVFKLKDKDYTTYTEVRQLASEYAENYEIVLQTASAGGHEIPVFLVGEGYTAEQIADGTYMDVMREACDYLFAIEPFKSYRNYFTVSTSLAVSPDAGISTATEPKTTKFGVSLDVVGLHMDSNIPRRYAQQVSSHLTNSSIGKALVLVVANHDVFMALNEIMDDDCGVVLCCHSSDTYPYDFRGLVQHYALGRTFGRLAREDVEHFEFMKACTCPQCNGLAEYYTGSAKGWYQNVSLNGGMNSVPWKHLLFDPRYSDIVDVYEGGYRHQRGVYRSENMTCMSSYIQYFGTWQRELIVRRIMELAGKPYSFEAFVAKDSREGIPE